MPTMQTTPNLRIDPSTAMAGTMMDVPLTIGWILECAVRNHARREIVSRSDEGKLFRYTYGDFAQRVAQLANALVAHGVEAGDRVASFGWNTHRHLELYYAVPMIGAVLHTANIRLFPDQLAWTFEHAGDKLIFVDGSLASTVVRALAPSEYTLPLVVMGTAQSDVPGEHYDYEELLASQPATFAWPDVDERAGAILSYTSATTGDPKGVVYTHRSSFLHALATGLSDMVAIRQRDTVMPVVPMFHVNAWGVPFLAPMVGAKLVLPGAGLDPHGIIEIVEAEGVTSSLGVPTVWLAVRDELEKRDAYLPSLKTLIIGGSAVPPSLFHDFAKRNIPVVHAWGMTEMSPIGTVSRLIAELESASQEKQGEELLKQGRFMPIVAWRLLDDDGEEVPCDGKTPGNLWVRGQAVTASYYRLGSDVAAFRDGYFQTGDVCTVDEFGYMQIVDRSKDLVKSGGEWISSIDLENTIMGHPAVREAAVIGVPHSKWSERPVAVVVIREEVVLREDTLKAWLEERVAKWWVPDRIIFADALPRTGVGKFLKRDLRDRYRDLLS
jgi:fatty-acyl-CoA synthase